MKKLKITENDANQRIDKYLKKLLVNAPNNFIYKMFRKKDIKVNGKKVDEKYILSLDDEVEMFYMMINSKNLQKPKVSMRLIERLVFFMKINMY